MKTHAYGWKKEPKNKKDYKYSYPSVLTLPKEVDLRPLCSPVGNQGNLGSCTGWSVARGMREFLQIKKYGMSYPSKVAQGREFLLEPKKVDQFVEMSPLWLYYQERLLEGTVHEDAGAYIRDGYKTLAKLGCAKEADWPYAIGNFANPPSPKADAGAGEFKITSYHRLNNLRDIKACLAEGYGCSIGFVVRESFEHIGSDGIMPMPKFWEKRLGGHAVFVVGYKDVPATMVNFFGLKAWLGGGYLIIKNSWGPGFGDKGYVYMPYAYVNIYNVNDMWTAR